ncbi:MAG: DNA polymerase IV [Chloroflexi bacterium]|nr:DNA polymerase IV [Chloroflexota bacterium]
MAQRWIIHADLDAFFASVEERLDPSLKGKPIIVGGGPGRRGVVASASYPARVYGVKSAMPTAQALRLCPQAILLPGNPHEYGRVSQKVIDLLLDYTPLVEQLSIDEAFLDVTGCQRLWGPPEEMAKTIQQRIRQELSLSSSLGVGTNKLIAKTACGQNKPGGLTLVPSSQEAAFLAPLPVEKLWGVGEAILPKLAAWGVRTIGDLTRIDIALLQREFGIVGQGLYLHGRGIDPSPVVPEVPAKSIGHEHTFEEDLEDPGEVERRLLALVEKVGRKLRFHGARGRTITLRLRTPDFVTITRSRTVAQPMAADQEIYQQARKLLHRHWRPGMKARLVGVSVSNLDYPLAKQLTLLDRPLDRLSQTLDWIREHYGEEAIRRGSLMSLPKIERLQDAEVLKGENHKE